MAKTVTNPDMVNRAFADMPEDVESKAQNSARLGAPPGEYTAKVTRGLIFTGKQGSLNAALDWEILEVHAVHVPDVAEGELVGASHRQSQNIKTNAGDWNTFGLSQACDWFSAWDMRKPGPRELNEFLTDELGDEHIICRIRVKPGDDPKYTSTEVVELVSKGQAPRGKTKAAKGRRGGS